jgi:hypothetical protein
MLAPAPAKTELVTAKAETVEEVKAGPAPVAVDKEDAKEDAKGDAKEDAKEGKENGNEKKVEEETDKGGDEGNVKEKQNVPTNNHPVYRFYHFSLFGRFDG